MYNGLKLGELPEQAILHELKVRVPEDILMHDDKSNAEGYLILSANDWYLSPLPPDRSDRPMYLLFMSMCEPLNDIVVV